MSGAKASVWVHPERGAPLERLSMLPLCSPALATVMLATRQAAEGGCGRGEFKPHGQSGMLMLARGPLGSIGRLRPSIPFRWEPDAQLVEQIAISPSRRTRMVGGRKCLLRRAQGRSLSHAASSLSAHDAASTLGSWCRWKSNPDRIRSFLRLFSGRLCCLSLCVYVSEGVVSRMF